MPEIFLKGTEHTQSLVGPTIFSGVDQAPGHAIAQQGEDQGRNQGVDQINGILGELKTGKGKVSNLCNGRTKNHNNSKVSQ